MSDSRDEESVKIIDHIQQNKAWYQVNFTLIEPVKKGGGKSNTIRTAPVLKYQTKAKMISRYYKQISRCIE